MGLLTPSKEMKLQCFFRDDNKFQFIRREMQFSCIVEKKDNVLKRAWKHFYACELPFPGYKKIQPGSVILGFSRDIILDIFNRIPEGEQVSQKPKATPGGEPIKRWIAKIAENQRHIYRGKRESTTVTDRIVWALIGVLSIETLIWVVSFLNKIYGK